MYAWWTLTMNIELDVDGERLDEGCTVDFTRESCIELVACDLHLQQTTRVPYSALGYRRRAGRWNRPDQTCVQICVSISSFCKVQQGVDCLGMISSWIWVWWWVSAWNLTREDSWSFRNDVKCVSVTGGLFFSFLFDLYNCSQIDQDYLQFFETKFQIFLKVKKLEKLFGKKTRKDLRNTLRRNVNCIRLFQFWLSVLISVHISGGITWSRIKISLQ